MVKKSYNQNYKRDDQQQEQHQREAQNQSPDERDRFNIPDQQGHTICYYLFKSGINIPEEWQDRQFQNPRRDENNVPLSMVRIIEGGLYPTEAQYHAPDLRHPESQRTVAMLLAEKGFEIPIQWIHNRFLRDKQGYTVQMIMMEKGRTDIPEEWYYQTANDSYDNSYAMKCALQGIIPSEFLYHYPAQTNIFNDTVALLLASDGIIPPAIWCHDPLMHQVNGYTVAMFLNENEIEVPEQWKYDPAAIIQDGCTSAMLLAKDKTTPSKLFEHDHDLQNEEGETVAIILAKNNIIPPIEWQHDPKLQDKNQKTVGIYLSHFGTIPPANWLYFDEETKKVDSQIDKNLNKYNYIYHEGKYIYNIQLSDKYDICIGCQKEKQLVKTKCGHKFCIECVQHINKLFKGHFCLKCQCNNWLYPIDEQVYKEFMSQRYMPLSQAISIYKQVN